MNLFERIARDFLDSCDFFKDLEVWLSVMISWILQKLTS